MGPKVFSIAVFCFGVSGCASAPPPAARLASSEASVRSAAEAGAASVTPASHYLALARDELAMARTLIKTGQRDLADLQLLRAQADAELALNIARKGEPRMP
jgi:Domain of unknown function (DUF4398)